MDGADERSMPSLRGTPVDHDHNSMRAGSGFSGENSDREMVQSSSQEEDKALDQHHQPVRTESGSSGVDHREMVQSSSSNVGSAVDNGYHPERAASDSEKDSRVMAQSPFVNESEVFDHRHKPIRAESGSSGKSSSPDGGRDSTAILDEEVRYQRELKDRIKRSYVDLGMKPEGILLRGDEHGGIGGMVRDSLEFDHRLDYSAIQSSLAKSVGEPEQGNRVENVEQHGDHGTQEADDVQGVSSPDPKEVVEQNFGENLSKQVERVDHDQSSIPDGRVSGQSEAEVEVETEPVGDISNGVLTLDPPDNKEGTWEDQFRDSLEDDPSGHGEGYLKDSLEVDENQNALEGDDVQADHSLQPKETDADGDGESVRKISPNRTDSRRSDTDTRVSGFNVNNNAKTVSSSPPDRGVTAGSDENRDRDVLEDTDCGRQGRFVNFNHGEYGQDDDPEQYDENTGYASLYADSGGYDLRQAHREESCDEAGVIQGVSNLEEFRDRQSESGQGYGGHLHQSYSAAYSEPTQRRQVPLPPPPMPPEPPPPTLTGKPPSAGRTSRPATNPFNVDRDLDDSGLDRHPDMEVTRLTRLTTPPTPPPPNEPRAHPPPPPPLTTQRDPPPSGGKAQPPKGDVRREPTSYKPRSEGSYLDQFRDKHGSSSKGDGEVRELTPSRTSDKSQSRVRSPGGSAGSHASLESLRFQDPPRGDSRTHQGQREHARKGSSPMKKKEPQVEYISEDSDDEDLHFVDEFGNPIDRPGKVSKEESPPSVKEKAVPKLEYRMKRVPSKKKQDSPSGSGGLGTQQGSGVSGKRDLAGSGGEQGNQTSQIPSAGSRAAREAPTSRAASKVSKTSQIPSAGTNTKEQQSVSEITQTDLPNNEVMTSTVAQMEGEREGALPSSVHGASTGGNTPLQSQVPQYVGHLGQQPQYVHSQIPMSYQGYQQVSSQFVTGQPVPGQMIFANQPAFISPNASYAFAPQVYAQLQQVVPMGMGPVQTVLQPAVIHQQPPQMFVGGVHQAQPAQVVRLPEQQQLQAAGNFGLSGQPSAQFESGSGGGRYVDLDGRRTGGTDHSPVPGEDVLTPGQSGKQREHPNGVRGLLAERREAGRVGQGRGRKKTTSDSPKAGKNFIDANRNNVRNPPSGKKYRDMYAANKAKSGGNSPMNDRQPLPNIPQDIEGDADDERWAYREGLTGIAGEEEEWTRRLIEDQRMMAMTKRSQSESNVLSPRRDLHGRDLSQGRNGGIRNADDGHSPRVGPGQMYSYSADRAALHARLQGPGESGGRADGRDRFAYTHPMPARCSPFEVLPGIERADNETRTSDPDGYLVKLRKQRQQPPAYKEYTLRDYRALKRDVKMGGLGPDPDLVQERQEKAQRQKEYARAIMKQNKRALKKASKPWIPPKEQPPSLESTKRGLALKYAKSVPKPPVRTINQEELHAQLYGRGSQQSNTGEREGAKTYMLEEMDKLEELAERHRQEKEEIEKLRNGHTP